MAAKLREWFACGRVTPSEIVTVARPTSWPLLVQLARLSTIPGVLAPLVEGRCCRGAPRDVWEESAKALIYPGICRRVRGLAPMRIRAGEGL
jgi:hypothetical protein